LHSLQRGFHSFIFKQMALKTLNHNNFDFLGERVKYFSWV
jgi:hypothetical protein